MSNEEDDAGHEDASSGAEDLPFSAALAELEAILGRIEAEEVDLDQLATELARAAELLAVCRAKIHRAEMEVTHIVDKLDDSGAD